jgi:hypothetical protein
VLSTALAPASAKAGGTVLATATLRNAVTWAPRAKQLVRPCTRAVGAKTWSCGSAVATSAAGRAVVRLRASRMEDVQWRYAGAPGAPAASSRALRLSVTRGVTLALSAHRVRRGHQLVATGGATALRTSSRVRLQQQVGGHWRDLLVGRTDSRGRFRFRLLLQALGVRHLRALVPASGGLAASTSPTVTVTVGS